MNVKISIDMADYYLRQMLGWWLDEHDTEAESLEEYREGVLNMEKHIRDCNDEKYARLAFAYLMTSDNISPKTWDYLEDCCNYAFVVFEFKEIVAYAYSVLWPDTPPEEALKGYEIELIKTGIDISDWFPVRDKLNPSFNHTN